MISQIATNKEQADKLKKLGIKETTADMYWEVEDGELLTIQVPEGVSREDIIFDSDYTEPRWSLSKVMLIANDLLSDGRKYIKIDTIGNKWHIVVCNYREEILYVGYHENLIDGIIEVIEKEKEIKRKIK